MMYVFVIFLTEYDKSDDNYPKLVCVITGKGPLKSHYQQTILNLKWNKVSINMPWLENEDYPLLLGKITINVKNADIKVIHFLCYFSMC